MTVTNPWLNNTLYTNYFKKETSVAPLAVFRIALGFMLFVSLLRFWSKGWIY